MINPHETRSEMRNTGEEFAGIMDRFYGKLKGFPGGAEMTSIARSETFITSEQLETLNEQVEAIRKELIAGGKNWTAHPLYKDWIEAGIKTQDECRTLYWDRVGPLTFAANQNPAARQQELGDEKLWVSTNKKMGKVSLIDITLRFDGTFTTIIGFQGRQTIVTYRVLKLPMERMTDEEYKIIRFYLDQYPVNCGESLKGDKASLR